MWYMYHEWGFYTAVTARNVYIWTFVACLFVCLFFISVHIRRIPTIFMSLLYTVYRLLLPFILRLAVALGGTSCCIQLLLQGQMRPYRTERAIVFIIFLINPWVFWMSKDGGNNAYFNFICLFCSVWLTVHKKILFMPSFHSLPPILVRGAFFQALFAWKITRTINLVDHDIASAGSLSLEN